MWRQCIFFRFVINLDNVSNYFFLSWNGLKSPLATTTNFSADWNISNRHLKIFLKKKLSWSWKDTLLMKLNNVYVPVHYSNQLIGPVGIVFTNGPWDLGLIPGLVIPKTLKLVLDTSLLNTQRYKGHIMGKVEQSRERSSTLLYTLV